LVMVVVWSVAGVLELVGHLALSKEPIRKCRSTPPQLGSMFELLMPMGCPL